MNVLRELASLDDVSEVRYLRGYFLDAIGPPVFVGKSWPKTAAWFDVSEGPAASILVGILTRISGFRIGVACEMLDESVPLICLYRLFFFWKGGLKV